MVEVWVDAPEVLEVRADEKRVDPQGSAFEVDRAGMADERSEPGARANDAAVKTPYRCEVVKAGAMDRLAVVEGEVEMTVVPAAHPLAVVVFYHFRSPCAAVKVFLCRLRREWMVGISI